MYTKSKRLESLKKKLVVINGVYDVSFYVIQNVNKSWSKEEAPLTSYSLVTFHHITATVCPTLFEPII